MFRAFNMGVGLVPLTAIAPDLLAHFRAANEPAWLIGHVVEGEPHLFHRFSTAGIMNEVLPSPGPVITPLT